MTAELQDFADFMHQATGLVLDSNKAYLVDSRLAPLLRKTGLADVSELLKSVKSGRNASLKQDVIDSMMTNETSFFRDRKPFDTFRDVLLSQLIEARREKRHIRIWCAAASTGQEPYSLAMILDEEMKRQAGWNIEILATDLSTSALKKAREARYTQFEVQRGLPISYLLRYFDNEGETWRLHENLRARVRFEEFNLLSHLNTFGQFDIIFCRNVLIYFDLETRRDVLRRLAASLAKDGFLITGSAETVAGLSDELVPHETIHSASIHRLEAQPHQEAHPHLHVAAHPHPLLETHRPASLALAADLHSKLHPTPSH